MSRLAHFAAGRFNGETHDYEGEVGNDQHITRVQRGHLPIEAVAQLKGARGEQPGEHTTRSPERYTKLREDIRRNGIKEPIFITVDHGQDPVISEGNNRRDVALELGHPHVPVHVRYFGKAERQIDRLHGSTG